MRIRAISGTLPRPFKKFSMPAFREETWRMTLLITGIVIGALGYTLFQLPHNINAGGVGGLAIVINHYTGWPVGAQILFMNIPLLIMGYFFLGRLSFIARTTFTVFTFAITVDLLNILLPRSMSSIPVTDDRLLSAIFAGVVGGIGLGLVYHGGGTMGGSSILARIVQIKTGIPLSQSFLIIDGVIITISALFFGWEVALYGVLALFLWGVAADYVLEGPSSVRMVTIVTTKPEEVSTALMAGLGKGVTKWPVTGAFTGQPRHMLSCTIYRPQVNDVKRILGNADPDAFLTIGVAHQAMGGRSFLRLKRLE
jgi:uncharacterized membrane-anchored protein YitT (DUF2179 family)